MSTVRNALLEVSARETNMAKVVGSLASAARGHYEVATLNFTGAAVDGDTFDVGALRFEIDQINTDSGEAIADSPSISASAKNITGLSVGHGITKGAVLRVDNEYMLVVSSHPTSVAVERGFAGSTAATHNNAATIYKSAAGVTGGNLEVPVGATLTNTAVRPLVTAALNYWFGKFGDKTTAVDSGSDGVVVLIRPYGTGNNLPANAESIANGTLSNFSGGADDASVTKAEFVYGPVSTAEASAGSLEFYVAGSPIAAEAVLLDDSAGTALRNEPSVSPDLITAVVSGQKVTVTEGSTAWEANADKVLVTVYY